MPPSSDRQKTRRTVLVMGFGAGIASMLSPNAAGAAFHGGKQQMNDFPFTKTDEEALRPDDPTLSERARALIRIGENGIARENAAALDAYFHPDFRFHGPGAELDREQLWSYFAACREAFDDFSVTRQTILSDGGAHLAARTRFSGVFARTFNGLADGPLAPNGKRFEYRPINVFRYAPDGRLAEEWVQYDVEAFMEQLRAT